LGEEKGKGYVRIIYYPNHSYLLRHTIAYITAKRGERRGEKKGERKLEILLG